MPDRDAMIQKLADDAVSTATSRSDLRWYVVEYFNRLSNGDLHQEFVDAGLEDTDA